MSYSMDKIGNTIFQSFNNFNSWTVKVKIFKIKHDLHYVIIYTILQFKKLWFDVSWVNAWILFGSRSLIWCPSARPTYIPRSITDCYFVYPVIYIKSLKCFNLLYFITLISRKILDGHLFAYHDLDIYKITLPCTWHGTFRLFSSSWLISSSNSFFSESIASILFSKLDFWLFIRETNFSLTSSIWTVSKSTKKCTQRQSYDLWISSHVR